MQELRRGEPDVAQWWDDQRVSFRTSVTRHLAHRTAGPLSFGIESVVGPHDPEQRLVVHAVEPDSPTAQVLPMLAQLDNLFVFALDRVSHRLFEDLSERRMVLAEASWPTVIRT